MQIHKLNVEGFAHLGIILVVLALTAVGGMGDYVYHAIHKAKSAATSSSTQITPPTPTPTTPQTASQPKPTPKPSPYAGWKTYMSADKIYSIKYPSNWSAGHPFGCSVFVTCVSHIGFSPKTNTYVYVMESKSNLSPVTWFNQDISPIPSEKTVINTTSINGYDTYHVKVEDKAYTDEYFELSHGGYILNINFREINTTFQPGGKVIASQQNDTQYTPDFTKMAKSAAFKN